MTRIPSILRVFGWAMFLATMFFTFNHPVNNFLFGKLGETMGMVVPIICLMPFGLIGIFGADYMTKHLKTTAATRGHEVLARVIGTAIMGQEGSRSHRRDIFRVDLEFEYEGKTLKASTEVVANDSMTASSFPPGIKVHSMYDPESGSIAMLTRDNKII